MSKIRANALEAESWFNLNGTENYKCRAWVNFNGTGTVAIRASGNVTSITDNGTGDYTVNFTTAMPDANYASALSAKLSSSNSTTCYVFTLPTTTSVRVRTTETSAATLTDSDFCGVAVFR